MRKLICLMTVLLLCASLIVPAFDAEEEGFVPSITYKPVPEIVPVQGEDGIGYIGVIRNAEDEIIDYVEAGCLRITPVAHLWDEEIEIPEDIEELLRFVYQGLIDRSVEIPYAELQAELADANMVIRDLFDARWSLILYQPLFAVVLTKVIFVSLRITFKTELPVPAPERRLT